MHRPTPRRDFRRMRETDCVKTLTEMIARTESVALRAASNKGDIRRQHRCHQKRNSDLDSLQSG